MPKTPILTVVPSLTGLNRPSGRAIPSLSRALESLKIVSELHPECTLLRQGLKACQSALSHFHSGENRLGNLQLFKADALVAQFSSTKIVENQPWVSGCTPDHLLSAHTALGVCIKHAIHYLNKGDESDQAAAHEALGASVTAAIAAANPQPDLRQLNFARET